MLHIDLPSRAEIEKLASFSGYPCISIYLRTTPLTQDAQADRIELKNLLKDAVEQLERADTPKRTIWPIEEKIEALIEDDAFWVTQAHSLAIFVTPEKIKTFRLANRLTTSCTVSDRFLIKPLLRAIAFQHHAFVLAISIGDVRLTEISADLPPHEVSVPGLPRDAFHVLGRTMVERKGDMVGGQAGSENTQLTRYARAVDQALRPVLSGHEQPMIVAAAEPMASIFKSVSTYSHLADAVISGAADRVTDGELAESARSILDSIYADEIARLNQLFAEREAQGRATTDPAQAARAATFGAIDTLIVDMESDLAGDISESDGTLTFAEEGDTTAHSITDEIVRRALLSGAHVIAARRADVPREDALAAILRYPI